MWRDAIGRLECGDQWRHSNGRRCLIQPTARSLSADQNPGVPGGGSSGGGVN